MDENGRVDYGEVASADLVAVDPKAPYGVRTNTARLLGEIDKALPRSRFVVVDFGDTLRADTYSEFCTDEQAALIRHQAVARLDRFVAGVQSRLGAGGDLLILLSPSPRIFSDIPEEHITPIVIEGPGYARGTLTSAATHRPGVVTISDVAPTVLDFFKIDPPAYMVGRPIRANPSSNAAEKLLAINLNASRQAQRQPAMRGVSAAQSVIVVLVTAIALMSFSPRVRKAGLWAALIPAAIPFTIVGIPLFYNGGLVGAVVWLVVGVGAVLAACALLFRSASRALVWLCAADVLMLAIDLLRGTPLSSTSIAGYGIMEGARYYGLGNELMGTMLGATLIGAGMLSRVGARLRGAAIAGVFACVFVLIGAPGLGAKTGGALAAVPAMVTGLLARRGWRPSFRGGMAVALLTLMIVGGLFAADAMRSSSNQTHMGRVVNLVASGDTSGLMAIVQRKVAVNVMLIATSPWSRAAGLGGRGVGADVLDGAPQVRQVLPRCRAHLSGRGVRRGGSLRVCIQRFRRPRGGDVHGVSLVDAGGQAFGDWLRRVIGLIVSYN